VNKTEKTEAGKKEGVKDSEAQLKEAEKYAKEHNVDLDVAAKHVLSQSA
jgi:hypothetical protein